MKTISNRGLAPTQDLRGALPVQGTSGHAGEVACRSRDESWTSTVLAAHWAPVIVLAALAGLVTITHGDQWLADRLYAWEGHDWTLRSSFFTERLVHLAGRDLSTLAWLGVLATWMVVRVRPGLSQWRHPLAALLGSTLLATAVVAWIKSWSNMDCPWDLTRYGGANQYVGLLSLRPAGMSRASCFPAGHASAGYAWMALYFFLLATRPRWRWFGLAAGVSLGVLFGASQQLRGAHFLSHDLWTAVICWACGLGGYLWLQGRTAAIAANADVPLSPGEPDIAARAGATWRLRADAR